MKTARTLGNHGRLLKIDLTRQDIQTEQLSESDLRLFMGGRGLGAAIMLRELPAGIDPLGEENLLIFSTGPLVDSPVPGSNRYVLHTKSPQTGLYSFSVSGGHFGAVLKKTGNDVIVIKGKTLKPIYLLIEDDGRVEFKDASHLWGKDTETTQELIFSEIGQDVKVTCIGPAGENLVPYACLINERRALGRGGAGAVMGSKNLKAVVVRGRASVELADAGMMKTAIKNGYRELKQNPMTAKVLKTYGSANMLRGLMNNGALPGNNWKDVALVEAESITAEQMREKFHVKDLACSAGCPVKCTKMFAVSEGEYRGAQSEGPDYETVYAFGSCCGVYDLAPIIKADEMCDLLGLDTISTGVSIAFAMECLEKGIIDADDTDAGDLAFGNAKAMLRLVEDVAYNRGFGAVVAEGTRTMAARFGQDSHKYAMHAKGMELGGYDPRGMKGMGLVYACGPRGGCHHAGGYTAIAEMMNPQIDRFAEKGKAPLVAGTRNRRASLCDSGLICAFVAIGLSDETVIGMLNGATGFNYQASDLHTIGDRISQVERAFNCREGLTRKDDTLPDRLLSESISRGPSKEGKIEDFEAMKDEFYTLCGWDIKTGAPLDERLEALDIAWVKDILDAK
jgi:aldehyde:ferredoxin oxidoreductase